MIGHSQEYPAGAVYGLGKTGTTLLSERCTGKYRECPHHKRRCTCIWYRSPEDCFRYGCSDNAKQKCIADFCK